jgi:hypothetical protein
MYLKAALFVLMLLLAAGALLIEERTSWRVAFILLLIWSSARAYYFAFYVIERYIDPEYRFSGIGSLLAYLLRRRK